MLEREATYRQDRRLGARLRFAKLRHQATPEDGNWKAARGLDRTLFTRLLKGDWIDAAESVILTGPTGVGKSWLACALGVAACRQNRSVFYTRATKLFADLAIAHLDGRYPALMRKLCSVKVLILDGEEDENSFRGNEFPTSGMAPLEAAQRREMMELIEERHGRHALIITSQRPTEAWHEMIGDPTYADAILDRIIHSAHRLKLGGGSIRDPAGHDAAP